jgi:protein arginine kinase activator
MKCQNCNANEANVHVTKIINGVKNEMHLCEECAKHKQELGINTISFGFPMSFQNIVDGLFEVMGSPQPITTQGEVCSVCGMTFADFRNIGRVGCSNCYNTFSKNMLPLIKRVHGNIQHTGKIPKRTGGIIKVRRDVEKLKEELRSLVENEEYEKAASVRDEIRNLENELNNFEK